MCRTGYSMTSIPAVRTAIAENQGLRRWISRAFLVSILVYLVVIAFLLAESITGASRWAPYGVNIPIFVGLIVASEVVVAVTAAWIFKEDSGIWPPEISIGWHEYKNGHRFSGLKKIAIATWDISLIDLRLRTGHAIFLGRLNRIAALVPLVYVLAATAASDIPWGMRASAIFDVILTVGVWAFMELVMVEPQAKTAAAAPVTSIGAAKSATSKQSHYEIRPLTRTDIPRVLELDKIKWRDQAATRESVESRLAHYPQGQLAVEHLTLEHDRVTRRSIVAWLTVMPINGDKIKTFGTWDEVSGNGMLTTADPNGDTIVGVNLTSVTNGATYLVLGEMLASVVEWNKQRFIGGARLNGLVAFNEHRVREGRRPFTAGEYANLKELRGFRINEFRIEQGLPALRDPEYLALANQQCARNNKPPVPDDLTPDFVCSNLRGYLSIPGSYVVELIPGYFPDPASDDWGVVIAWDNPLPAAVRWVAPLRRLVANRIRTEVRAEWESRKQRLRERSRDRSRVSIESPAPARPVKELARVS